MVIDEIENKKKDFGNNSKTLKIGLDKYIELKKELIKIGYIGYSTKNKDNEKYDNLKIVIDYKNKEIIEVN